MKRECSRSQKCDGFLSFNANGTVRVPSFIVYLKSIKIEKQPENENRANYNIDSGWFFSEIGKYFQAKPLQNSPKSYKFSPNKNEEDFSHV